MSIIHTKRPRPRAATVRDIAREVIYEVPGPKVKPPGKPVRMAEAYRTGFRELKRNYPEVPTAHLSFEEKVLLFEQCPVAVSPTLMDVFQMVGDRDEEQLYHVKRALKKLAVRG